ncbi:MAG: hypothetical protein Kow0037_13120 [Calditrichia bacterium]
MKDVLRTVLAVIGGIVLGGVINMGLVILGGKVIPPPAGVNVADPESLKASMHLFQPIHFLFPFLAHALGTLTGAWVAALISRSWQLLPGVIVGAFFLLGGIANVWMLPAPFWFEAADLLLAYIPMGWLGARLAGKIQN